MSGEVGPRPEEEEQTGGQEHRVSGRIDGLTPPAQAAETADPKAAQNAELTRREFMTEARNRIKTLDFSPIEAPVSEPSVSNAEGDDAETTVEPDSLEEPAAGKNDSWRKKILKFINEKRNDRANQKSEADEATVLPETEVLTTVVSNEPGKALARVEAQPITEPDEAQAIPEPAEIFNTKLANEFKERLGYVRGTTFEGKWDPAATRQLMAELSEAGLISEDNKFVFETTIDLEHRNSQNIFKSMKQEFFKEGLKTGGSFATLNAYVLNTEHDSSADIKSDDLKNAVFVVRLDEKGDEFIEAGWGIVKLDEAVTEKVHGKTMLTDKFKDTLSDAHFERGVISNAVKIPKNLPKTELFDNELPTVTNKSVRAVNSLAMVSINERLERMRPFETAASDIDAPEKIITTGFDTVPNEDDLFKEVDHHGHNGHDNVHGQAQHAEDYSNTHEVLEVGMSSNGGELLEGELVDDGPKGEAQSDENIDDAEIITDSQDEPETQMDESEAGMSEGEAMKDAQAKVSEAEPVVVESPATPGSEVDNEPHKSDAELMSEAVDSEEQESSAAGEAAPDLNEILLHGEGKNKQAWPGRPEAFGELINRVKENDSEFGLPDNHKQLTVATAKYLISQANTDEELKALEGDLWRRDQLEAQENPNRKMFDFIPGEHNLIPLRKDGKKIMEAFKGRRIQLADARRLEGREKSFDKKFGSELEKTSDTEEVTQSADNEDVDMVARRATSGPGGQDIELTRKVPASEIVPKIIKPVAAEVIERRDFDRSAIKSQRNVAENRSGNSRRVDAEKKTLGVDVGTDKPEMPIVAQAAEQGSENPAKTLLKTIDKLSEQTAVQDDEIGALYQQAVADGYVDAETKEPTDAPEAKAVMDRIKSLYDRQESELNKAEELSDRIYDIRTNAELSNEERKKAVGEVLAEAAGLRLFGFQPGEKQSTAAQYFADDLEVMKGEPEAGIDQNDPETADETAEEIVEGPEINEEDYDDLTERIRQQLGQTYDVKPGRSDRRDKRRK